MQNNNGKERQLVIGFVQPMKKAVSEITINKAKFLVEIFEKRREKKIGERDENKKKRNSETKA